MKQIHTHIMICHNILSKFCHHCEMPFNNVTDPWPHHALSSLDYIYIITIIDEIPLNNGANPCSYHVLPQYTV